MRSRSTTSSARHALQLADALAASGNPEGAYREYQRAADLLPDDADVQKKAATFLFLAGQFEDVRTRVEAVLKKNPKDVEAQLLYANALVGLQRSRRRRRARSKRRCRSTRSTPRRYTNLALLKLAQGQRAGGARRRSARPSSSIPSRSRRASRWRTSSWPTGNLAQAEQSLKIALALDAEGPARPIARSPPSTSPPAATRRPRSRCRLVAEVTKSRAGQVRAGRLLRACASGVDAAKAVLEPMLKDAATYGRGPDATGAARLRPRRQARPRRRCSIEVLMRQPNHSRRAAGEGALAGRRGAAGRRRSSVPPPPSNASPRDVGALFLRGTLQALNGQRDERGRSRSTRCCG